MGNDPDDFMVRTQEEMASVRTETTKTMTTLLAAIAGVSLLVGGIGIMNIMLVSVTERTREIGLRMAIGARGRDVLMQFLVEAVVLSLFGGLLGIAMGYGLSAAAEKFLQWPDVDSRQRHRYGIRVRRWNGCILRILPSEESCWAGSNRSAPVRIAGSRSRNRSSKPRSKRMKRARTGIIAAAILAVAVVAFARSRTSPAPGRWIRRERMAMAPGGAAPGGGAPGAGGAPGGAAVVAAAAAAVRWATAPRSSSG
jgi:hypothetical protein